MLTPCIAQFDTSTLALTIPIVAIVLGCSIPLAYIVLNYRRRKHLFELYHQERMAAISKGIELPPLPEDLFQDWEKPQPSRPKTPRDSLLKGLVWLFVGMAIVIAVGGIKGSEEGMLGLIPAGIGLAHLIYYFVEGRKAPHQSDPRESGSNPES
jgi:hypothetical protein